MYLFSLSLWEHALNRWVGQGPSTETAHLCPNDTIENPSGQSWLLFLTPKQGFGLVHLTPFLDT